MRRSISWSGMIQKVLVMSLWSLANEFCECGGDYGVWQVGVLTICNMADTEMDDLTEKIQNVMLNNCLDHYEEEMTEGENTNTDPPSVLIATNVHLSVFEDPFLKVSYSV